MHFVLSVSIEINPVYAIYFLGKKWWNIGKKTFGGLFLKHLREWKRVEEQEATRRYLREWIREEEQETTKKAIKKLSVCKDAINTFPYHAESV